MKVLNDVTDSAGFKKYEHGIQKPRGLENAAIQRNKHRGWQAGVAKTQVPKDVVEISAGTGEVQKPVTNSNPESIPNNTTDNVAVVEGTYAKLKIISHVRVNSGNDTLVVGSEATANINSHVETDNGDDIIVIGDSARLNINSHIKIDNGNDTLIIGPDADVTINSHVETDNGDDVLVVGDDAKLHINNHVNVDNGNDTIVVGQNADVNINSHVGIDNGNDTLVIGDGAKLNINSHTSVDEGNDTLIIGEDADVKINSHTSIDNIDDTFFIPALAKININIHEKMGLFSIFQDTVSRANEIYQKRMKIKDIYRMVKKDESLVAKNKKGNKVNSLIEDDLENLKIIIENDAKNKRLKEADRFIEEAMEEAKKNKMIIDWMQVLKLMWRRMTGEDIKLKLKIVIDDYLHNENHQKKVFNSEIKVAKRTFA